MLIRIDPITNRVVARVQTPRPAVPATNAAPVRVTIAGDGEGQVAVGFGSVWICGADGRLLRIDPTTNRVTAAIPVPQNSSAVISGYGSVWLTNPLDNSLTRIDPRRNTVQQVYPLGNHPQFLAAGSGAIWVVSQADGKVTRLDPISGGVQVINAESAGDGGCVAVGLGAVWLTIPDKPITRIEAATNAVTEQFTGAGGDCITTGFGAVWLVNNALGNLYRITPP